MIIRYLIYFSIIFFSIYSQAQQDPVFVHHIQKFDHIFGTDSSKLPVVFERVNTYAESFLLGVCFGEDKTDGTKLHIGVDKYRYDKLSEIQKELFLFHELAHCIMKLDHEDFMVYTSDKNKFPGSLMYFYNIEPEYVIPYYVYYLRQLMWLYKGTYWINMKYVKFPEEK